MKAKILFLVLMLTCVNNIIAANAKLSSDESVLVNYIDKHKTNPDPPRHSMPTLHYQIRALLNSTGCDPKPLRCYARDSVKGALPDIAGVA